MDIPRTDIDYAKTYLSNFGQWYRGPNPLNAGFTIEDADERASAIAEAWTAWSSYTRNYFMAMLNTLGGHNTLALEGEVVRACTPAETFGARAAMEGFWKRNLLLRGQIERRGAWAFTPVQLAIIADEDVNAEVFQSVERTMENQITSTLRTRRNMLRQLEDGQDHDAGLQEDFACFFGRGRPVRCSAEQRNANYDLVLF